MAFNPIIKATIQGQIVGSWVVIVHPTSGDVIYGGFPTKGTALEFAENFMEVAQVSVSPVYWPTLNRG